MKKNYSLYIIVLIIILKPIFQKKFGLNEFNVYTVIYYLLLVILGFIVFKNYKPKNKSFWLALLIYIIAVVAISLYPFFL